MSNNLRLLALALIVVGACGGPDPEQTGFVVLDEEARAAGIGIETMGERHEGALPIPVDASEGATVVGPDLNEEFEVAPGEVVEVQGAEGRLVRGGRAERDRLVVSASESGAQILAEMTGARLDRRRDGRWELTGADVFFISSMLGGVPEVMGSSAYLPSEWVLFDASGESAEGLPTVAMDAPRLANVPSSTVPGVMITDPAAVVGVYRAAGVTMIVDAAHGYQVQRDERCGPTVVQTGTWSIGAGSLFLDPAGEDPPYRVGVTDASIYEASGVELQAVTAEGAS